MKKEQFLVLTLILNLGLVFMGCMQSKKEHSESKKNKSISENTESEVIDGEGYSDSMINVMLNAQKSKKELEIDTFDYLHNIECELSLASSQLVFNMDSVRKYEEYRKSETMSLDILEASNCFSKYKSTAKYDAYIFYSELGESHYSNSFSIVVIDKNSNNFEKLNLAVIYGNEMGDYVVSSVINDDMTIDREINHNVRYLHGVGEVDSIYIEREKYQLSQSGNLMKINYSIEPSKRMNNLEF